MKSINLYYLSILVFTSLLFYSTIFAHPYNDAATDSSLVAKVNTETLNVRNDPDINSNIIGTLNNGETVEVIENLDYWVCILLNGEKGWVYKPLVTLSDNDVEETAQVETTNEYAKLTDTERDYSQLSEKLAVCMNQQEVKNLIGEPDDIKKIITQANTKEIWKYHLNSNKILHVTFLNGNLIFHQVSLIN